jgi:ABC-type transport system involved in cytochrome c biogenesis ATPase subunit
MEEQTVDHGQAIVIATNGLTKTFAHLTAVNHLDMEVRRGDIFGFLGPNGSGKTTTIRMLLGLLRPTAGRVQLFGLDNSTHLLEILPRVGAIVETPVFYPYLSGVDNLRIVAAASGMQLGKANQARIDEVLDLVDLSARGGDAYRKYSLGMKQRLAIYAVPTILFLMLLGTVIGTVMAQLAGIGTGLSFFTAARFGHLVLYLLLGMLYWFGYMLMALFFGTVGCSTVAGIVGPLVWLAIEPLLGNIIAVLAGNGSGGLADFLKAIPDYFFGNNLSSLLHNQGHTLSFSEPGPYVDGHWLLVIAVYLIVFAGVACWLTVRRDVTN